MSINEDFYSHFPSLNSNSMESQRNKRISRDYADYLKQLKPKSPKQTKQQQLRSRRSKDNIENVPIVSSSNNSSPPMDVIFSAEERNKVEYKERDEKKKSYQKQLQRQIEEQKIMRQKEVEKQLRDEITLERRLQKQLESIKLHKDSQSDRIVERVSLSENEKEFYNDSKLSNLNTSNDNKVYRYFSSQSAKTNNMANSDLFNYKKYFSDIMLSQYRGELYDEEYLVAPKASKSIQVALHKEILDTPKKTLEINSCPSCTRHAQCSRCHKKLAMYCKECNEDAHQETPQATNHLQIEYNEPELPFSKEQQVVVYRHSDQNAPFSFNIEPDSIFYKDTNLEEMRKYSEMKLANYMKNYGDLRKQKFEDDLIKTIRERPRDTGAIPKHRPLMNRLPEKNLTLTPNNSSDLEEILSSAQYTVITQIGFAKKQLEKDKLNI